MLERSAGWLAKKDWSEWPRFFLHTGDQIYADDIGVNMGTAILHNALRPCAPGPPDASADASRPARGPGASARATRRIGAAAAPTLGNSIRSARSVRDMTATRLITTSTSRSAALLSPVVKRRSRAPVRRLPLPFTLTRR